MIRSTAALALINHFNPPFFIACQILRDTSSRSVCSRHLVWFTAEYRALRKHVLVYVWGNAFLHRIILACQQLLSRVLVHLGSAESSYTNNYSHLAVVLRGQLYRIAPSLHLWYLNVSSLSVHHPWADHPPSRRRCLRASRERQEPDRADRHHVVGQRVSHLKTCW